MNLNQHVLITGASRGLGRALALQFAKPGVRLSLVARSFPEARALQDALSEKGAEVLLLGADVGDPEAAARIVGRASGHFGPIDVLVHNASTLGPVPLVPLLDTEPEELAQALAVNLVGPFRLSRLVAGSMVARRAGTIAYVGSDAAVEAYPAWGAYGASKAGGEHMHRILGQELAEFGVRVAVVDPGEMNTVMHADAVPEADVSTLADPADVAERFFAKLKSVEAAEHRWELSS